MKELKDKINYIIDLLKRVYIKQDESLLLDIISSSNTRIEEGYYDFGEMGYQLVIVTTTNIYLEFRDEIDHFASTIQQDINKELNNIYADSIYLQNVRIIPPKDINEQITIPGSEALDRIWKPNPASIRIFISHTTKHKNIAMDLKNELLNRFGILSFVAHHDIEPTEEWSEEILNALSSFDVFIALLTEEFNQSKWTDQEIGFAVARNKLIIPINIDITPYGFISKYQQLKYNRGNNIGVLGWEIVQILERKLSYPRIIDMWVEWLNNSSNYAESNQIIGERLWSKFDLITEEQKNRIKDIGNQNRQVREAHEFEKLLNTMNKNNHEMTSSVEPPEFDEEDIPFS
ncbi:MAG: toll/interleukin-1 receptor domain-containing protein [Caldisericia bacterium]|nr:toll/interleukin-1 receptor domain-containing protein [Caldisericia bacterium]